MVEIAQDSKSARRLTREEIVARLSRRQHEIREKFGVTSLELFGSAAHNAAHPTSDVDILVEFVRPVGLFHFFALQDYLESLLEGQPVDLVLRSSVLEALEERIFAEAIPIVE